ncbi:MAG: peptidoglycan editing factor PgeF [Clostridiales bacterium]|nr:peptidoglycan editing factor PgeF [Clostridiales bacterium]
MEKCIAENGVVFYRSEKLSPVRHGFSTRLGGISTLDHTAAMNLAFGRGDDGRTVIGNLELFCSALKINPRTVVSLPQVHSNNVLYVKEPLRGGGYFSDPGICCDGYVTDRKNIALGVKIADCVPILLSDNEAGVIAAIHAGWRGTALQIVARGVKMMCEIGAAPHRIAAAIGPAIGQCCYEIGEEVVEQLTGLPSADQYISPSKTAQNKYYADLKALNRAILMRMGVPSDNIDISPLCTACLSDLFHSHRKTGGVRGTMLAVISL